MDRNRILSISICTVCLAVAGYVGYSFFKTPADHPSKKAYFTVDEGATRFVDDGDLVPPFDHHGKLAVRFHIFSIKGKEVPGYLERYPPNVKKLIESAKGDPNPGPEPILARNNGSEVRAVNGDRWVPIRSSEGDKITAIPSQETVDVFEKNP